MAWSWRIAIMTFIIGMYNGDTVSEINTWIYVIIVTLSIAFYFAIIQHYYCLYPRAASKQKVFNKKLSHIKIGKLIKENCKYVVGFAWRDAIMTSLYMNEHKYSIGVNIFLYWTVTGV